MTFKLNKPSARAVTALDQDAANAGLPLYSSLLAALAMVTPVAREYVDRSFEEMPDSVSAKRAATKVEAASVLLNAMKPHGTLGSAA